MPTVEQNLQSWGHNYDWPKDGEEWSAVWGGSEAQWFGAIFPRIHSFLPAPTILEIAPGFGRWTHYLKNYCDRLEVVDLSEDCINKCRQRFASCSNLAYHVNDGRSLDMIADHSIDFAFSFDSLVHAEVDVLQGYLSEMGKKLKPNGVGFFHHSNIGSYRSVFRYNRKLPKWASEALIGRGILDRSHWRGFTMTAQVFEAACEQAGLQCISQELVNWGTKRLIDCFSLFTRKDSQWARPNRALKNPDFMREAAMIKRLSRLYSRQSPTD